LLLKYEEHIPNDKEDLSMKIGYIHVSTREQNLNLESAVEGVARKLKVLKIGIFIGLFN